MLLATTEDEAVASMPDVVRMAVDVVETQVMSNAKDAEDEAAAAAVSDGFHCDTEPFAARLVAVLQAQRGADFGGAKLEAQLNRFRADVRIAGTALEAEVSNREYDEVEIDFFLRAGNPAERVSPIHLPAFLSALRYALGVLQVPSFTVFQTGISMGLAVETNSSPRRKRRASCSPPSLLMIAST